MLQIYCFPQQGTETANTFIVVLDTARHNVIKIGKIGIDVKGKAVHGHPSAEMHTNSADFFRLLGHPWHIDPDTCVLIISARFDIVFSQHTNDDLLKAPDIPVHISEKKVEIEDRVAY